MVVSGICDTSGKKLQEHECIASPDNHPRPGRQLSGEAFWVTGLTPQHVMGPAKDFDLVFQLTNTFSRFT